MKQSKSEIFSLKYSFWFGGCSELYLSYQKTLGKARIYRLKTRLKKQCERYVLKTVFKITQLLITL